MILWAGAMLAVFGACGDSTPNRSGPPSVLPDLPVTPANALVATANNSPTLAADPTESRFVAMANRLDAPDFGCALQLSGDSGRTWITAQPVPTLPEGAEKCYAPEIAFDRKGKLYYLFVGLAGRGNAPMGVYLATSLDRGRTFGTPWQVLGPSKFGVRMALDPSMGKLGRIHLAWIDVANGPALGGFSTGPNPIVAAHSDDGGRSFSPPLRVSSPSRPRVVAPALALGPHHRVHIAYYDLGDDARDYQGLQGPTWDGTWSVILSTSVDGGSTFRREVVVNDAVRTAERAMLIFTMPPPSLVALEGSRVCVAWTDARHGDPDALLRCSDWPSIAWEPVRRVNDDPEGNGLSQSLPRLGSSGGVLDVIFNDRRLDIHNGRNDVYYAYSPDGGRTFEPNVRLTRDDSKVSIGPRYGVESAKGKTEFGSRLGILATPSGVVAVWTDTRNSLGGSSSQDLFATNAVFPGGRESGMSRGVVALGGIVLALVVLATVKNRYWLNRVK